MNVARIQERAESGDLHGAEQALEALLEMGPRNLEALKLKAQLFAVKGRFFDEAKIWEKVSQIAREDDDLLDYLVRRQTEDREHFYFTDPLQNGGKKFLAFPRRLMSTATFGFIGCLTFLTLARLGTKYPILVHPVFVISAFFLLVAAPFLGIMISYMRSTRYISVGMDGVEVAKRIGKHKIARSDVEKVYLAYDDSKADWTLHLVFINKDKSGANFHIDFGEHSTAIRARTHFLKEIMRFFGDPESIATKDLHLVLAAQKVIKA
jgi:hypothetical protein